MTNESEGTTSSRWPDVERLLDRALELPPDQRGAFLDRECAGDPALRAAVEGLLRSSERPHGFLDGSAGEYAAPLFLDVEASESAPAGARIGPYRIVREAGHGGMGTVYDAERDEPYHQRVALKIVRGGLALDDHAVRRLREERQILASLEHPRIARLLDGGVTAEDLPWFAMEYVDGEPIDRYCERRGLSIEELLRLFLEVCDAVQYAHRNLVVHRDLKPSNILVTAEGEVKLLDFGIAKLLGGHRPDTMLTQAGLRVLTPEYASPEQVRGEPVTVASDVYALGVLLYELLTGRRPYRLASREPHEVARAILEQEPERPSAVVADPRLRRRLKGDLDTIVLTALRKEPDRRYPTVERLATDLERHRKGLPVTARPDTFRYRTGKFVRRHRIGVAAAAAVALSLVAGAVGTAWQAREASRNAELTAIEAAKQREVKEFMIGLFRVSDPERSRGREITARELLERGVQEVDKALARQPEVQAELLHALGVVHRELGLYGRADTLLERSVRLSRSQASMASPELAERLADWAAVLGEQARFDMADSLLREALALRRLRFGPRDSTVAATLRGLGYLEAKRGRHERAEKLHRQALAIDRERHGGRHLAVAEDLDALGGVLYLAGRLAEADRAQTEALAIRRGILDPDHPAIISVLQHLAAVRLAQGRNDEAESLLREVVARRRRLHPEGHPALAIALNDLATALSAAGRSKGWEAESLYVEALAIERRLLGRDNPETIVTLNNLTLLRYWQGDLRSAEAGMREVVVAWGRTLGEEHPNTLTALTTLGGILRDQDRYDEAEPLLRRSLAVRRRVLGGRHPDVAQSLNNLGTLLDRKGDRVGAERALREALAIRRASLPAGHPFLAWDLTDLGSVLVELDRAAEAEPLLREALTIRTEKLGPDDRFTAATRRALGVCLARLGRHAEAEDLLLESYRDLSGDDWWTRREREESMRRLAWFYQLRGNASEAARFERLLGRSSL